mgnify:CR=1 FL=1
MRFTIGAAKIQKICDSCKINLRFCTNNLRFYVKSSVQHNKSCPISCVFRKKIMFGHNLPRCAHPCDRRCALASFSYYACAHVPYIILIYTYAVLRTALIRAILLVCLIFALKSSKNIVLIFSKLQRKCIFSCIFFQKYLVMSKKSSTFASAFEKQTCFYFLPEARTLKFRFSLLRT